MRTNSTRRAMSHRSRTRAKPRKASPMGDDEDHAVAPALSWLAVDVTLPGRIAFGHRIDDQLVVAGGFLVVTFVCLGVRSMNGMHIPLALHTGDLPAS